MANHRPKFTAEDDRKLALGYRKYNKKFSAIRAEFLQDKTEEQIKNRLKNQSSSNALENPIKEAKREKESPLTTAELERINLGLRVFNHDWNAVWEVMVPHRDPAMIRRQWHVANGKANKKKTGPSTSHDTVPKDDQHVARGHMVKLAPGLPLVKLPPSVRVTSQSTFNDNDEGQVRDFVFNTDLLNVNTHQLNPLGFHTESNPLGFHPVLFMRNHPEHEYENESQEIDFEHEEMDSEDSYVEEESQEIDEDGSRYWDIWHT